MCGGTEKKLRKPIDDAGLSPRVRGNQAASVQPPAKRGTIPACAGEPPGSGVSGSGAGDYPRVCGGTAFLVWASHLLAGLSPRVRGNRPRSVVVIFGVGTIPACAGEPLRQDVTGLDGSGVKRWGLVTLLQRQWKQFEMVEGDFC